MLNMVTTKHRNHIRFSVVLVIYTVIQEGWEFFSDVVVSVIATNSSSEQVVIVIGLFESSNTKSL
jgi:hypothetical protein